VLPPFSEKASGAPRKGGAMNLKVGWSIHWKVGVQYRKNTKICKNLHERSSFYGGGVHGATFQAQAAGEGCEAQTIDYLRKLSFYTVGCSL